MKGGRYKESGSRTVKHQFTDFPGSHTAVATVGSKGKSRESKTQCGASSLEQPRSFVSRNPGLVQYPVLQKVSGSLVAAGPTQPQLCSAGLSARSFQLRFLREATPLNLSSKEHLEGSRVTVPCCSSENTSVLITESVSRGFSDRVSHKPLLGKSSLLLFLYKSPARPAIGSTPIQPCSAETADS